MKHTGDSCLQAILPLNSMPRGFPLAPLGRWIGTSGRPGGTSMGLRLRCRPEHFMPGKKVVDGHLFESCLRPPYPHALGSRAQLCPVENLGLAEAVMFCNPYPSPQAQLHSHSPP
jgi:hypothetical protein